ncbi:MAG: hybrid sensor histidine kinase/response regulator [Pseudomonadota bacterium]
MIHRATQDTSGEILVVEDTPASLKLLSELLGNAGYLVRQAPDGELALWSAHARPPELILLDIRMPGIDGFEVCRRLKADAQLQDIPVIFLSAQYDTDDKVRGFQAGAVDFIAKPYQSEEVLARTRAHIRLARTQHALAASNAELTRTLAELNTARAEIVRSERLAALGALVAGVAHELNTPIGNSVLAASALDDRTRLFVDSLGQGVRRSELEHFGMETSGATALLLRNLHKAADLIECFKQVAVDQTSSQRRSFELATLVDGMVKTLLPSLRESGVIVRIEPGPRLEMDSFPGALCQILTQLTRNALLHAFAPGAGGEIVVSSSSDGAQALLRFCDNGGGIAADCLARVFDPFYTTKMGKGTSGLGLHIVHNLIANVLGGSIRVSSKPGATCFDMRLPLRAPALGSALQDAQGAGWLG